MTLSSSDPVVREALRRGGWSEGRRVDTSGWVEELKGVGYEPHPLALRIWAEFGGLTIRSVPSREPGSRLYIDPVDACIDSGHHLGTRRELRRRPRVRGQGRRGRGPRPVGRLADLSLRGAGPCGIWPRTPYVSSALFQ
ncbi:SUKH-3 domain-containing protein [Streptomyces sp. NPDC002143]